MNDRFIFRRRWLEYINKQHLNTRTAYAFVMGVIRYALNGQTPEFCDEDSDQYDEYTAGYFERCIKRDLDKQKKRTNHE